MMFEDCETFDTITVETNRRETINKHLREKIACKVKTRGTDVVVAVDILFKARIKGGKRTGIRMCQLEM